MSGTLASRPDTTLAGMVWPAREGAALRLLRGAALGFLGACLLTISAKTQVPGPVPMTLQTLAVMAIGAGLGMRLALASVLIYLAQGALGLPVFANTPPQVPNLAYFLGPTGGFLLGFAAAAAIVGAAADRGLLRRPVIFGLVLTGANVVMLAVGCIWLAFLARTASGTGIGLVRAFEFGVQPFLVGNAIKLAIAALSFPLLFRFAARFSR
ncbi:biotin transporter BioY [Enterovirga aerilata]|uniref:Biotin transporter n=1 Tax=Enterovirga aerilata TaxID=2730920 RepID=A0A849IAR7_9HYPH|nr:biotin transporter BioY [Enterovirga sp. DB1703]NNM73087.1 biotin transporter BioY [Enterovirga sp. DB1703]